MTSDIFTSALSRLDNLSTLNSQRTSSGQKIQKGSEDSLLYSNIVDTNSTLSIYDSVLRGFDKEIYKNETIQTAYDSVKDNYDSVASIVISLKSNYTNKGDYTDELTKLTHLRDSLLNVVNDKVNGSYVFSGVKNSMPAIKDDNFALNGKVSFEYKDKLKTILVGKNEYAPTGALPNGLLYTSAKTHTMQMGDTYTDVNGDDWKAVSVNVGDPAVATTMLEKQGTSGRREMFEVLSTNGADITFDLSQLKITDQQNNVVLRDAYETPVIKVEDNVFDELNELIHIAQGKQTNADGTIGADITDADAKTRLGELLSKFTDTYTQTAINSKSEFAGRATQIIDSKDVIEVKVTHLKELKSKFLDADVAQLAVEASQLKIAYQGIYAAISRMSELSLVNFLK